MKAPELRIGNWVYLNNDNHINKYEITSINANGMLRVSVNGIYPPETTGITKISPVPLTEEWLLKFGLKRVLGFIYKNKEIEYNLESHDLLIQVNNHNYMLNKFKYVHQLQNLYFSLVGEELETKTHL